MTIYFVGALVLIVTGTVLLLNLTPERVADDMMSLLTPKDNLREQVQRVQGKRDGHRVYQWLVRLKGALGYSGSRTFSAMCFMALVLFAAGTVLAISLDNLFLIPVLAVGGLLIPFFYVASMQVQYKRHTRDELETALSIVTSSYIRNDDIVSSVRENLPYIKPPLRETFSRFVGDATAVTSSLKRSLKHLRSGVDNEVFREWCDTLILCQDDRTLKETLSSIVTKLTDIRIVNSELNTILASARNEYRMMVTLVFGNIPLLYVLNKEWFYTLFTTTAGKVTLAVCCVVVLVTAALLMKWTRPIEYKQ